MSEMSEIAIIGGTGLTALEGLKIQQQQIMDTPYGSTSGAIIQGEYAGKKVIFLPRHGAQHTVPPHKINYRANIWSLQQLGVKNIIAVAAVGGINAIMQPTDVVIPHQLIDYTWGREHTFASENNVLHVDFGEPYSQELRANLLQAGQKLTIKLHGAGVYAVTQGPRLETAAEINKLERDGCDIVGMTAMPEAALARELELKYATCALVVNAAAGRSVGPITMAEIDSNLQQGMQHIRALLVEFLLNFS